VQSCEEYTTTPPTVFTSGMLAAEGPTKSRHDVVEIDSSTTTTPMATALKNTTTTLMALTLVSVVLIAISRVVAPRLALRQRVSHSV
jgi:hypothetical protein